MEKINVLFKMMISSLVLIFYNTFGIHKTGLISFYELFGYPSQTLDLVLSNVVLIISIVGSILLFYSSIMLFIESIRFLNNSK